MGATVKSDAWASRGSIVILDRLVPAWAMTSLLLAGSTRTDPTSSRGAGCRPSRRCPQYRQLIPLMRITCTVCGGRIVSRAVFDQWLTGHITDSSPRSSLHQRHSRALRYSLSILVVLLYVVSWCVSARRNHYQNRSNARLHSY